MICATTHPLKTPSQFAVWLVLTLLFVTSSGCSVLPAYLEIIPTAQPLSDCSSDPTLHRKRLALIRFEQPQATYHDELAGLSAQFSEQLLQALRRSDRFILDDLRHATLEPQRIALLGAVEKHNNQQIIDLASPGGAQLIVQGRFLRFTPESQSGFNALLGDPRLNITFELRIFETIYGTLVSEIQRSYIWHGLSVERPQLRDSRNYFRGPLQEVLQEMVKDQADLLTRHVSCIPLITPITVIDDRTLTINVGVLRGIRPGDRFKVVHRQFLRIDNDNREHFSDHVVGVLEINRVQADMAQGTFLPEGDLFRLQPGDYVRSW
ncbi:MAG: hypothetical protein HQL49_02390 [Gammaproteobacteria bacterium]|nr:hypothetical protein [Gammaproteobacteria bacterium]